jgi:hypothetical protein
LAEQDDIELHLRRIAPLCLEIARDAQEEADALRGSDWGRRNLSRTASANQVSGTARRRMVCDTLVERRGEFDGLLEVTSTESAQNQGQYYMRSTEPAFVLTVRRKPHEEDEQPVALQMQLAGMRELVELEDEVIVYFEIPPHGKEPCFEIVTRGQERIAHRLCDLIDDHGDSGPADPMSGPAPIGPRPKPPAPSIRSTLVPAESTEDEHGG